MMLNSSSSYFVSISLTRSPHPLLITFPLSPIIIFLLETTPTPLLAFYPLSTFPITNESSTRIHSPTQTSLPQITPDLPPSLTRRWSQLVIVGLVHLHLNTLKIKMVQSSLLFYRASNGAHKRLV